MKNLVFIDVYYFVYYSLTKTDTTGFLKMTEQKVKFFRKIDDIRRLANKIADDAMKESNATRVAYQDWSFVHGGEKKTAEEKSKLVNRLYRLNIDRKTKMKAYWRAYKVEKKARKAHMLNNTLVKTTEEKANAWKEIANAITDVFYKTVNASELSSELLFNESDEADNLSETVNASELSSELLFNKSDEADNLSETAFKKLVLILLEKVKIIKRNATVEMKTAINDNETTKRFLIATKAELDIVFTKLRASKDALLNAIMSTILKVNKDELEKARIDLDIKKKKAETMYDIISTISVFDFLILSAEDSNTNSS